MTRSRPSVQPRAALDRARPARDPRRAAEGRAWTGWRGSRLTASLGLVLLAAVAVLCLVVRPSSPLGLPMLFVVPVGLLAFSKGLRLGMAEGGSRWFEMSNELLVEASLDGYFTRLSVRWEACLGWTREELMARPFRELVHPDDLRATNVHADALDERPGEVHDFENRYLAKDGSWRWLLWSARSDEHRKYAVARDITERKLREQERQDLLDELEAIARTDALTGLPNRRAWDEELRRAIARATSGRAGPLALAMIDLDEFKVFNDANGHAAGDTLLVEAAARWRGALRTGDFLARYGGEEFAVLLPDCAAGEAEAALERLRGATPAVGTCSIGVAHLEAGDDADRLVARADEALYEAKRTGRNRLVTAETARHRSQGATSSQAETAPCR